jgi:hypothetical protein
MKVTDGYNDKWHSRYSPLSPPCSELLGTSRFIKKGEEVCVSYIDQRQSVWSISVLGWKGVQVRECLLEGQ